MSTHRTLWVAMTAVAGLGAYAAMVGITPPTPGVKNIEDRYSSAGGSKDHLPGRGTKMGEPDNVENIDGGQSGYGNEKFAQMRKEQDQGPKVARKGDS